MRGLGRTGGIADLEQIVVLARGGTPVLLKDVAEIHVGSMPRQGAVIRDGKIVVRHMMVLSLVFDHRLVDGAPAAQFLQYLKDLIEAPNEVTLTK